MSRIKMLRTVMLPLGKFYAGKEYDLGVLTERDMVGLVSNKCAVWLEQPVAAVVEKVPAQVEAVEAVPKKRRFRKSEDGV